MRLDLNCDMGEGFGAWKMGDDEEMLNIVTTANVACGFHAGDPSTMFRTAASAKSRGVAIGAHPGFADLLGFGRRVIRGGGIADIESMIAYQIGAFQAVASLAGHQVTHVKPHGAFGNMVNDELDLAMALGRRVRVSGRVRWMPFRRRDAVVLGRRRSPRGQALPSVGHLFGVLRRHTWRPTALLDWSPRWTSAA